MAKRGGKKKKERNFFNKKKLGQDLEIEAPLERGKEKKTGAQKKEEGPGNIFPAFSTIERTGRNGSTTFHCDNKRRRWDR